MLAPSHRKLGFLGLGAMAHYLSISVRNAPSPGVSPSTLPPWLSAGRHRAGSIVVHTLGPARPDSNSAEEAPSVGDATGRDTGNEMGMSYSSYSMAATVAPTYCKPTWSLRKDAWKTIFLHKQFLGCMFICKRVPKPTNRKDSQWNDSIIPPPRSSSRHNASRELMVNLCRSGNGCHTPSGRWPLAKSKLIPPLAPPSHQRHPSYSILEFNKEIRIDRVPWRPHGREERRGSSRLLLGGFLAAFALSLAQAHSMRKPDFI